VLKRIRDQSAVVATFLLAGCATVSRPAEPMVRLHNASAYTLEAVQAGFPGRIVAYGSLRPGADSSYKPAGAAYRYARLEARLNGRRIMFQPIDYVGETRLPSGYYTYTITVDPEASALIIENRRDR
jgi:hypothetical protein